LVNLIFDLWLDRFYKVDEVGDLFVGWQICRDLRTRVELAGMAHPALSCPRSHFLLHRSCGSLLFGKWLVVLKSFIEKVLVADGFSALNFLFFRLHEGISRLDEVFAVGLDVIDLGKILVVVLVVSVVNTRVATTERGF